MPYHYSRFRDNYERAPRKPQDCKIRCTTSGTTKRPECSVVSVVVEAGYNEDFIKKMKTITAKERDYDEDKKLWYFHPKHLSRLVSLAESCDFSNILIIELNGNRWYKRKDTTQADLFEDFL